MSLKLVIQKKMPNMFILYVNHDEIWASSNYTLCVSKDAGNNFNKVVDLKVPFLWKALGKFRLSSRAFRLGIRDLRILKSETFLVIAAKKIFRLKGSEFEVVHSFERGLGPLRGGWCEDEKGNCYLGEYFLNNKRDAPVHLIKSEDDGQSWRVIRSLSSIRHIHCVQYDPFSRRIWMGTGDRDEESSISFSEDEGRSWTEIGSGNQMFRTVSLLFTEDHVYWGSDAPTRQNFIYRYKRKNGKIERLVAVDGSVHQSAILDGIKLFATAAEGNSEGRSAEWDRKAHIWASEDGIRWEDLTSWEKDFWPYILGYGRVLFANGRYKGKDIYFTTQALKKVDNVLIHAKLYVEANL